MDARSSLRSVGLGGKAAELAIFEKVESTLEFIEQQDSDVDLPSLSVQELVGNARKLDEALEISRQGGEHYWQQLSVQSYVDGKKTTHKTELAARFSAAMEAVKKALLDLFGVPAWDEVDTSTLAQTEMDEWLVKHVTLDDEKFNCSAADFAKHVSCLCEIVRAPQD